MIKPVRDGNVAQVNVVGTLCGQTVINTFHYRFGQTTPVWVDGDTIAIAIKTAFVTNVYGSYVAAMPPEWSAVAIEVQWISPTRYRKSRFLRTDVGTGNTTQFPNTSASITLQGDVATRRAQASKHIPGVGELDVTAGVLTLDYMGLMIALADALKAVMPMASGTATPVIYGRYIPADPTAVPPVAGQPESIIDVSTYYINPNARVQRRRTVGLGV